MCITTYVTKFSGLKKKKQIVNKLYIQISIRVQVFFYQGEKEVHPSMNSLSMSTAKRW